MTDSERWLRLATAISGDHGVYLTVTKMCIVTKSALNVDGVSIVLMADDDLPAATFISDPELGPVEEAQFVLGIGPAFDAHRWGVPVAEAELVAAEVASWPGLATCALNVGFQTAFSFPLRIGAARLGALTLYRYQSGSLDAYQYPDALVMADVLTHSILILQSEVVDDSTVSGLAGDSIDRNEVRQATGVVSIQLDIGVGEALSRLRARAFVDGTSVCEVALAVISRKLRFE